MATELFKETMQELKEDYISFAKDLNTQSELNPESLKVSFIDYTKLYLDYLSITIQDDDFREDDDYSLDDLEEDKEESKEETY